MAGLLVRRKQRADMSQKFMSSLPDETDLAFGSHSRRLIDGWEENHKGRYLSSVFFGDAEGAAEQFLRYCGKGLEPAQKHDFGKIKARAIDRMWSEMGMENHPAKPKTNDECIEWAKRMEARPLMRRWRKLGMTDHEDLSTSNLFNEWATRSQTRELIKDYDDYLAVTSTLKKKDYDITPLSKEEFDEMRLGLAFEDWAQQEKYCLPDPVHRLLVFSGFVANPDGSMKSGLHNYNKLAMHYDMPAIPSEESYESQFNTALFLHDTNHFSKHYPVPFLSMQEKAVFVFNELLDGKKIEASFSEYERFVSNINTLMHEVEPVKDAAEFKETMARITARLFEKQLAEARFMGVDVDDSTLFHSWMQNEPRARELIRDYESYEKTLSALNDNAIDVQGGRAQYQEVMLKCRIEQHQLGPCQ